MVLRTKTNGGSLRASGLVVIVSASLLASAPRRLPAGIRAGGIGVGVVSERRPLVPVLQAFVAFKAAVSPLVATLEVADPCFRNSRSDLDASKCSWTRDLSRPMRGRSRRAMDLVKLLALAPGHRVLRGEVLETLWPKLGADAAASNLELRAQRARRSRRGRPSRRGSQARPGRWRARSGSRTRSAG